MYCPLYVHYDVSYLLFVIGCFTNSPYSRVGNTHVFWVLSLLIFINKLLVSNSNYVCNLYTVGQCVTVPVGVSICLSHVFSRTVAVVDTKHGYVGRYNGHSAKQESGEV